jgi:hypothetical protein
MEESTLYCEKTMGTIYKSVAALFKPDIYLSYDH